MKDIKIGFIGLGARGKELLDKCPALIAKNIMNEKIYVDGIEHCLNVKNDTIKIDDFKNISIK